MSDLQCAVRVFVARHGEAVYESELLSDAGGWLSTLGRDQARVLAESMTGERIARVWTSDLARAVQTGEIVAGIATGSCSRRSRTPIAGSRCSWSATGERCVWGSPPWRATSV